MSLFVECGDVNCVSKSRYARHNRSWSEIILCSQQCGRTFVAHACPVEASPSLKSTFSCESWQFACDLVLLRHFFLMHVAENGKQRLAHECTDRSTITCSLCKSAATPIVHHRKTSADSFPLCSARLFLQHMYTCVWPIHH